MSDEQLPTTSNGFGVSDLSGLGRFAAVLVGPIFSGIGKALGPFQQRRENRAQIDNFNAWEEALAAKHLSIKKTELTLSERAEVRVLAEAITHQHNRESVAVSTIEYANLDITPVDPEILPPDQDWLNRFWAVAEKISNEDMQRFFGMILARRATSRAKISARALEFLALLSGDEARALERIAGFAITVGEGDNSVCGVMSDLSAYGLEKGRSDGTQLKLTMHIQPLNRNLFGSLGIFVESGWAQGFYYWKSGPGTFRYRVGNRLFEVEAEPQHLNDEGSFYLGSGVALSPLGREIVTVINPPTDERYLSLLHEWNTKRGLATREIT